MRLDPLLPKAKRNGDGERKSGSILVLRRNNAVKYRRRMGLTYLDNAMSRSDLILVLLAVAAGRAYSPAQLQKSAFLVTTNLPSLVTVGPAFDFQPYDYGPFDRNVYVEAQALRDRGEAELSVVPFGRWVTYAATQAGITRGEAILSALSKPTQNYIQDVSKWALSQSFNSLVKSIYDAYPAMREKSIFRDPA